MAGGLERSGVIGLVTDSKRGAARRPEGALYDVAVVPLTVVVDDHPYQEGVDITAAEFYQRLAAGAKYRCRPPRRCSGAVLTAYEQLAAAGVTEILSIYIGSN